MNRVGWIAAGLLLLGATWTRAQQPSTAKTAGVTVQSAQSALALEQQGRLGEAEAAWRSVIKTQPDNADAFAHLGLLEAREQRYTEAIAHYRKARALKPAMPQLTLNLGLALFKSENYQDAAKLFEAELKQHPNSPNAARFTILAAMSEYGLQHYAAAAPYLRDAAVHDPQNLPLRLNLAHCYLWTRQFDAAMDVYKEILAIDPNSAEADMIAGEALDEKGDSKGAIEQFRAAAKANPKEPNVHFGLGYLLWTQRQYEEAIREFKAELENDAKNTQAMIYLGDTYVQMGAFDQARAVLEQAAALRAPVSLLHLDLGIVYSEAGDNAAAVKEVSQAVAMEPASVKAHFRLAKLYQSMGRRDEAKTEFNKASSLNQKINESLHQRIAEASARPEGASHKDPPVEQPDVPEKP